ncbi:uncharacterized protein ACLA_024920 [Aspergillus clavatus NRRL 1]|uniref:Uncharacterized protein n=1 Tax=Aspergillus clavatus (strain ATCC 1007 / CBS 513.65 / DSM 816 / NCTC 3887 / NRRL 1 / QM 1276 / 107) TaxID=344612 RepID=A1CQ55_ASPCL|nr:uncharacterized protein ACLA_024920 [Aspergillus clavatus NRRL 1]EAW07776.1 conserved hypothetical protein [Aspergillus clavatus NRRL 1]
MAVTLTTTSSMNKRWPPLADKSSLPFKLTTLSKQKLAREATAPDPDIRRCLGHFRLHCTSMEWAQRDMTSRINSFDLEDSESEEEEEEEEEKEAAEIKIEESKTTNTVTSAEINASVEPENKEQTKLHVSFEVAVAHVDVPESTTTTSSNTTPSPEKEGLLEKGRSCLEKTVQMKNFWPARGPCLPVRIAG